MLVKQLTRHILSSFNMYSFIFFFYNLNSNINFQSVLIKYQILNTYLQQQGSWGRLDGYPWQQRSCSRGQPYQVTGKRFGCLLWYTR